MSSSILLEVPEVAVEAKRSDWTYEEAFKRNRGLVSEAEQEKLRNSRVVIAGMGGVGGSHLITLARLGVGKFTIADPDTFEVANFNRQHGATVSNLGRNKAEAMAAAALDINPDLDIRVMPTYVDESNVGAFLDGADLFVDGFDFFAIEARRMTFNLAAQRGVWAVTAGPIGFSTAWLAFDPSGMGFDDYFDIDDESSRIDSLVAFAVGLTPKATHLPYMDLSCASVDERTGPSAALACQLASGVVGSLAVNLLLQRDTRIAAPWYSQFDAYRAQLKRGKLRNGNRGIVQQIKRRVLKNRFEGRVAE
ncbi:putative adenylyltransferase/sulfurtransferase MoeZ [Pseudobythopirellula maris]|uniref:Putative adenylyltransferase/sulfurtransferase MoeZ n=1 Tax=Pseudobythopirellula maris TaxID=2527991 RepID=A0A5C5ZSH4_9BACT|nr:ThiF family adenylyltransferase [Pseudobythopirellula maris]TWT89721.1 putative adenylyltransferase/sulfurtransferase MoeZ [Pseudobythopirellula maris]